MLNPAFEAFHPFHRIAEDLTQLELSHIWQGHGSSLFLEFGTLSPRLRHNGSPGNNPLGQISIGLNYAWRIEESRRVLCGSDGDSRLWPDIWNRLVGKRPAKIELFGVIPELRLTLQEQRLFSFSLDEDGPKWEITDNRKNPHLWVYWEDGALKADDGQPHSSSSQK